MLVGRQAHNLVQTSRLNHANARIFRVLVDQLAAHGSGALFVAWGAYFPFELVPIFEGRLGRHDFDILPTASFTNSPLYFEILAKHGIRDVYSALWDRPGVWLLGPPWGGLKALRRFIREHYGDGVSFRTSAVRKDAKLRFSARVAVVYKLDRKSR